MRAEHEAQARTVEVNTARLRSPQLAKAAADNEAEVKKEAEAQAKNKSSATKKKRTP